MSELSNKIVIITGAAGSLGSTTATTFAAQGATVVLVVRGSRETAVAHEAGHG